MKRLINRFRKKIKENTFDSFVSLSDLLYYSIKKQNEKIAQTISRFMYDAFKQFRDKSQGKEVVYPAVFYEAVSKTIEELATQRNRRFVFLEHRTAGSVWLLGEFGDSKISEITYSWIWSNFLLALKYDRDDYIIYHWEHAFQYASYSLRPIHPEYPDTPPINEREINERKADRKRFLEFHYALGGLLLYKGRYKCIQRVFQYTQSLPPQYELLPDTMDEVFGLYFHFRDPYEMKTPWISQRYYFPDTGGINSDAVVKTWICKYIAVLFLRQYSIVPYLMYMEPLRYPAIPAKQSEKREWIDNLDYFKKIVGEMFHNKKLLNTIGLGFITDEWCEENKVPKPLEFVEKVKQDTIASFEGTLVEQSISEAKVEKFKLTTAEILTPVFDSYEIINNNAVLTGEINKLYINGESHIIDKSGVAEDQYAEHINFDSFLPESFSHKFRNAISEIFFRATSQRYLLNPSDIIPAIERLNINKADYVIVSFGLQIKKVISDTKNDSLNGIEIIEFGFRNYNLIGDSLFVLKRTDLPKLRYHEIEGDETKKYSLIKSIEKYNIYISVVDLNKAADLRDTLVDSPNSKDLRKSAYMAIFIRLEVQWKKDVKCIQIKQASAFRESGIPNNLSDVKPIEETPQTE